MGAIAPQSKDYYHNAVKRSPPLKHDRISKLTALALSIIPNCDGCANVARTHLNANDRFVITAVPQNL
jgi:hypothetical protein